MRIPRFLFYPIDVLLTDGIPRGHIFLHAIREAGRLAGGERRAGFGDALLETVLIHFLPLVSLGSNGRVDERYLDQLSGIGHGCFLTDLVHDLGFGIGRESGAAGVIHRCRLTSLYCDAVMRERGSPE